METKKRIYIGLLASSLIFIMLGLAIIWYLVANRHIIISQVILFIIATIAAIALLVLSVGILAIVLMILRPKTIPSMNTLTQIANELLFPLTLIIGKLLGIDKEKILRSYIAVNNYLVSLRPNFIRGENILILVPHCLQDTDCPHKITVDVSNCKGCGKCQIGELKKIAEESRASIRVVTGGTMARKRIEDDNPRGVVAIACERDLSAGIQDAGALPVIGVLNCRPNGPCFNTSVDLQTVKEALKSMSKGE